MASDWQPCIVTLIDLIGIKKLAHRGSTDASTLMRKMHSKTKQFASKLLHHTNVYVWNDSILLVAELLGKNNEESLILKEATTIKKAISNLCETYAISVKRQLFPETEPACADLDNSVNNDLRVTVLRASSYALANCSLIEYKLGKKLRKPWYIDGRIAVHLTTEQSFTKHRLSLMPRKNKRLIYSFDGDLW